MVERLFIVDHRGMRCQLSNKTNAKSIVRSRVRTISETIMATVDSSGGSGYDTETEPCSSIEYLNLCTNNETRKNKKIVTIMEPNGQKVHPFKPNKKEKVNDGNKKIGECGNIKSFLDISSSNLTSLSRSISKLPHLTHLYIYGNKISKIPKEIGLLVKLQELWMQENDIHYLPTEMKNCRMLRHLDLRHNHLGDECFFVIKYFTNLEILLLNNNKLSRLDGIGRLKKLKTLSVKSNKLEGILNKSLWKLRNLVSLDLSKNKIVSIPDEIGKCVELQRLNLEYNRLIELPESIGKLLKLEIIGLKYNRLEKIPFSISDCVALKEFNIESNLISEISEGMILKLQQVVKINISHNKFTELPGGCPEQYGKTEKINAEYNKISHLTGMFIEAKHLRVLNLCYNNLTEITSADIRNLTNLVDLNISFNQLKELPKEINRLTHLESLDLTNNALTTLPRELGELQCLKFLNLESNGIVSVPDDFGLLSKLKNLNISCNQLKTFPRCLVKLKSLEMLNISENLFSIIPEAIGNLEKLTHLFLKDNKNLNDLPISISAMKNLTFLSINGCPLKEIPGDYTKSPTKVVAYLRALQIGLRLHQYLQKSGEEKSLTSSDTSINVLGIDSSGPKNVEGVGRVLGERTKKVESSSGSVEALRPRSASASAASKEQHLNSSHSRKSIQNKIAVPDYLLKKMKTTEAGFLACSNEIDKK